MTNSKLIYIEDDQILGNLITQALVGNDSSEESLNNVISQFRKKFRSDEHIHISTHPVLDHGRIVESNYYGNVFYVLIMDCQLLDEHYD